MRVDLTPAIPFPFFNRFYPIVTINLLAIVDPAIPFRPFKRCDGYCHRTTNGSIAGLQFLSVLSSVATAGGASVGTGIMSPAIPFRPFKRCDRGRT